MRFSTFAALAAVTLFAAASIGTTEAHGPTRQKVSETIEINAPPEKVWAVIGNFQDFSWHPAVTKTEGKGGNAVDATRTVTLQGGGTIDEVIAKYEPREILADVPDQRRRREGAAGDQLFVLAHRLPARRRQALQGGVARRLLSRLSEQRPAAGTRATRRRSRR